MIPQRSPNDTSSSSPIDKLKVLIVEDDAQSAAIVQESAKLAGWQTTLATSIDELWQQLDHHSFHAILLDVFLGPSMSLTEIPKIIQTHPHTRIVVATSANSIELAIDAMKKGAAGYVTKSQGVAAIIEELKAVLVQTNADPEATQYTEGYGMIGTSLGMRRVRQSIDRMKNVNSTVLIHGESGTGKELVAKALHEQSNRAKNRFAAINCAAIPENLLESELFGHKRGAFTDASCDRKGYFELCSGGTLFLDEIGDMPLLLQAKLLRVLESHQVTPIGGSVAVSTDTRIVAATNRDLREEVRNRRFREDLYYRLSVLSIEIPPLRDRTEDISRLVESFISKYNDRFGKFVALPSLEVIARLKSYPWKGNVRELQNTIERAVVLAVGGNINLDDLLPLESSASTPAIDSSSSMLSEKWKHLPFSEVELSCQKEYFSYLLKATHGNISEVSRISGEHRARIYRIMKRLNVNSDSSAHTN